MVGRRDAVSVGLCEITKDGIDDSVGVSDETTVGLEVGFTEEIFDGKSVFLGLGFKVGSTVGVLVGMKVFFALGFRVGNKVEVSVVTKFEDGVEVGCEEEFSDGLVDKACVGSGVGNNVKAIVGAEVVMQLTLEIFMLQSGESRLHSNPN